MMHFASYFANTLQLIDLDGDVFNNKSKSISVKTKMSFYQSAVVRVNTCLHSTAYK